MWKNKKWVFSSNVVGSLQSAAFSHKTPRCTIFLSVLTHQTPATQNCIHTHTYPMYPTQVSQSSVVIKQSQWPKNWPLDSTRYVSAALRRRHAKRADGFTGNAETLPSRGTSCWPYCAVVDSTCNRWGTRDGASSLKFCYALLPSSVNPHSCFHVWLPVCSRLNSAELIGRAPVSCRNRRPACLLRTSPNCRRRNGAGGNTDLVSFCYYFSIRLARQTVQLSKYSYFSALSVLYFSAFFLFSFFRY